MSQTKFELKDVTVSFSTMLNKPEKAKYGRGFKILVPVDSPVLDNVKKNYNELNELAKVKFGESLGKKLKNAKSEVLHSVGKKKTLLNTYINKRSQEVRNAVWGWRTAR